MSADIREGLQFVLTDRVIRSLAVTTCLLAASTGMLQAVLVLHVMDTLHAPQGVYGVLFTVFAAGYLIGTRLTSAIGDRFGLRICLLIAASLGVASLVVIGCAPNVYVVGIGMVLLGIGSMIYNVSAMTVRQQRTPSYLLGRVSSIANLVGVGAIPIAALLAGALATAFGTRSALFTAATLCGMGVLWLLVDMRAGDEVGESLKDATSFGRSV